VKATRAFGVPLNLSTGDSTTALIELESGAAGTLDTTIRATGSSRSTARIATPKAQAKHARSRAAPGEIRR